MGTKPDPDFLETANQIPNDLLSSEKSALDPNGSSLMAFYFSDKKSDTDEQQNSTSDKTTSKEDKALYRENLQESFRLITKVVPGYWSEWSDINEDGNPTSQGLNEAIRLLNKWAGLPASDDHSILLGKIVNDRIVNDFLDYKHLSAALGTGYAKHIINAPGATSSNMPRELYPQYKATGLEYDVVFNTFMFSDKALEDYKGGVTGRKDKIAEYFNQNEGADVMKLEMTWEDCLEYPRQMSDIFYGLRAFTLKSKITLNVHRFNPDAKSSYEIPVSLVKWEVELHDVYDFQFSSFQLKDIAKKMYFENIKSDIKKKYASIKWKDGMENYLTQQAAEIVKMSSKLSTDGIKQILQCSILEDEGLGHPFNIDLAWTRSLDSAKQFKVVVEK